MSHPDEELLVDLALGSGAETSAEVRDHVDGCPVCATTMKELRHTALASHVELPPSGTALPTDSGRASKKRSSWSLQHHSGQTKRRQQPRCQQPRCRRQRSRQLPPSHHDGHR